MKISSRATEIMQRLKLAPIHGYELYKILKEKGLVKKTTEIYREIQKLRDAGLVTLVDEDHEGFSTDKKLLRLTPEGERMYYELGKNAFKAMNKLAMVGLLFKLRRELWGLVRERAPEFFSKHRRVLIDHAQGDRGGFLKQLAVVLRGKLDNMTLFLHQIPLNSIDRVEIDKSGTVSVVDANARLVPHDYDAIITIGIETPASIHARASEPRTGWLDLLSLDGVLIVGLVSEARRHETTTNYEAFLDGREDIGDVMEKEPPPVLRPDNAAIMAALGCWFETTSIKTAVGGYYDILICTGPGKGLGA